MAILSDRIYAVPDGKVHPEWFEAGETVTGSVEEAAIAQGKVVKAKAIKRAPENK